MWQPRWEGRLGEDGYIYVFGWVGSLFPWTITTLLLTYTLIQNKKFKKKTHSYRTSVCVSLYLFREKAMATHSSTLAWNIPWTEEPGRLQSKGSQRVGQGWATSLSLFTFMHWRRKWKPTPVFLPGESQGRGNRVGCSLWGRTELDTTEVTWQQ